MTDILYKSGDLVLDATVYNQYESLKVASGVEQVTSKGGGFTPKFVGSLKQDPRGTFSSPAIAKLLTSFGLQGAMITVTDMYALKCVLGGTLAAGSVHKKITLNKSHGILRRISASQGSMATGDVELISTFDGTNEPITETDGVAAPAASGTVELFTLGPLYFDTTLIEIQSVDIDTGIQDEQSASNGSAKTGISCVTGIEPKVTVSTKDLAQATFARFTGEEVAVTLFLRQVTENSGTYDDAELKHIKVVIPKASIVADSTELPDSASADQSLMITPVDDLTNAIMTATSGVAIVPPV